MKKLIVSTFLTLDGVMQAPGGAEEDPENDFTQGGWQLPFFGAAGADGVMVETLRNSGSLLLGRKTYDIFASYWPHVGHGVEPIAEEDIEFATVMNSLSKYVASTTLHELEWQNSTLLEGDAVEAVRQLKADDSKEAGKDISVIGSGNFTQTLMRAGLVDEYSLMVHPLILGSGKRLFPAGTMGQTLELINSTATKNGIVVLTYKVKH